MGLYDTLNQKITSFASSALDIGTQYLSNFMSYGSDWSGLNPNLVAHFFVVKKAGENWITDPTEIPVHAPLLEGSEIEYVLNWQSPFEQTGTENKIPTILNMLQSGYASDAANKVGVNAESSSDTTKAIKQFLDYNAGRTGITKLNSIQTFSGMPPIKCTLKLLFRARTNESLEVMQPLIQLLKWAVPQELSKDGTLVNIVNNVKSDKSTSQAIADTILPSVAPKIIGMQYKGRIYKPMVIESITDPITSPTTSSGGYARAEITLSLASLTALDRKDIESIYGIGL